MAGTVPTLPELALYWRQEDTMYLVDSELNANVNSVSQEWKEHRNLEEKSV